MHRVKEYLPTLIDSGHRVLRRCDLGARKRLVLMWIPRFFATHFLLLLGCLRALASQRPHLLVFLDLGEIYELWALLLVLYLPLHSTTSATQLNCNGWRTIG